MAEEDDTQDAGYAQELAIAHRLKRYVEDCLWQLHLSAAVQCVLDEHAAPRAIRCLVEVNRENLAEAVNALKKELRILSEVHDATNAKIQFECVIPAIVKAAHDQANKVFQICVQAGEEDPPQSENVILRADFNQSQNAQVISAMLLSGGGYRATAFHLGVLRWLYEHTNTTGGDSALAQLTRMVGISGGSITAAHFAKHRTRYIQSFEPMWELIEFLMKNDLRTPVLEHGHSVSELLKPLLGENDTIPDGQFKLDILGTSLRTGNCIAFSARKVARLKIAGKSSSEEAVGDCRCLLRNAVAASAAFPPVLPPLWVDIKTVGAATNSHINNLAPDEIADGGIRDNTGLEYAISQPWGAELSKILVSDAGRPFDWSPTHPYRKEDLLIWGSRLGRVVDIFFNRIAVLLSTMAPDVRRVEMSNTQIAPSEAQLKLRACMQPLIHKAAGLVSGIHTDLVPLGQSQVFALIRQGFDTAASELSSIYPINRVDSEEQAKFWDRLWPKSLVDQHSLVADLERIANAHSQKLSDPAQLAPMVPGQRWFRRITRFVSFCYAYPWLALAIFTLTLLLYTCAVLWLYSIYHRIT